MESMQCCGIDSMFNQKVAQKELQSYQNKGPNKTTKILLDQLILRVEDNKSLLDIGGGVGAISHELSQIGLSKVINVDASKAYLQVAKSEADRLGYGKKASFYHGDFVTLASQIPSTDLVTLDRVICCYSDMERLVTRSIEHAKEYYGKQEGLELNWVFGYDDSSGTLYDNYGKNGIPYLLILDKNGNIYYSNIGYTSYDSLADKLDELI